MIEELLSLQFLLVSPHFSIPHLSSRSTQKSVLKRLHCIEAARKGHLLKILDPSEFLKELD